jgi:hypothetical protein
MDIPDNFTITIHSETAPINYTVLRCSDDMFVVKWERPKNSFHYVELSRVEVINALSRGIWTIVEQKENNMEQQTIKQMEQNVAELLAKAEEMKQLIEKAKKEETWPNYHDAYWYASGNGHVYRDCWENTIDDLNRQKFGNIHRSRAEAEDYVQKRLVQVELENLAKKSWKEYGKQLDWNTNCQNKHHIFYDYQTDELSVSANSKCQHIMQVFFPTIESAKEAISTIGEERLKVLLK